MLLHISKSSERYNILLTSAQLAFEIFKYLINDVSPPDSAPSEMLFITETEALWIWSLNPKSFDVLWTR